MRKLQIEAQKNFIATRRHVANLDEEKRSAKAKALAKLKAGDLATTEGWVRSMALAFEVAAEIKEG